MSLVGPFIAFFYVVGSFLMLVGVVIAGLSLASPLMFSTNLLDARAYTLDYLGWVPGVDAENQYTGTAALALALLGIGIGSIALGSLMVVLPGLV